MNESKLKNNKTIKIIGATLFSILVPGLGQISCGKIKRGVFIYITSLLLIPICLFIITKPLPPFNIIIPVVIYGGLIIFAIIDALLIARDPENTLKVKPIISYLLLISIWLINSLIVSPFISATVKKNFIQAYKIPSAAMTPTLLVGDHLLVDKHIYKNHNPNRGDIVIFPAPVTPEHDYVKRIVALGGDTIEIKAKQIFINGKLLQENHAHYTDPIIIPAQNNPRDYFGPVRIPGDSVFVMGDNRDHSYDSRFWGVVKTNTIKAKVINLYWSWDKDASAVRWSRIGKPLT